LPLKGKSIEIKQLASIMVAGRGGGGNFLKIKIEKRRKHN
jgi:hypothetical protein